MGLSNSFTAIFDKAADIGKAHVYKDKWVVEEHESSATMDHLEVMANGTFTGFDHNLVKGVKDITTRMSCQLDDKDCDGVAFLTDSSKQEHLVFAELKSGFDVQKITAAFHQITMSFIKMHAWLSLCKHYDLHELKVHFITACRCCRDQDQEDSVMLRISQAQQLGKETFETKFLKPLLNKHNIKVKLSSFGDIQKLPFHDYICDKDVTMYLQLTGKPTESQVFVTLV
jgi:hypothetical protein